MPRLTPHPPPARLASCPPDAARPTARLLALTLLAFALGVHRLAAPSLGLDEGFSVWVARMSPADALRYLTTWDAHPPLYYFLLHCWIAPAGDGEFAARLTGVAPAVLLVPLVYQTGRALAGPRLGWYAALVTAPSPFLAESSQLARMYSLATALGLLAVCLALRLGRPGSRSSRLEWLGLLAAALLGLATLYLVALVLLGLALLLLARALLAGRGIRSAARWLAPYAAVGVATALLYLPWLPSLLAQARLTGPGAWRTFVDAPTLLARTWSALALGEAADPGARPWLWAVAAGIAAIALVGLAGGRLCPGLPSQPLHSSGRVRPAGAGEAAPEASSSPLLPGGQGASGPGRGPDLWARAVCAGYLLAPLAAIQLISYWQPAFSVRYVTLLIPAYSLLVGLGLLALRRIGRLPVALAAALVLAAQAHGLSGLYFDPRFARDDFRGLVGDLDAGLGPGDVVLVSSSGVYPVVDYYLRAPAVWRGPLQAYQSAPEPVAGPVVLQIGTLADPPGAPRSTPEDYPQSPGELERGLARLAAGARRVWYLRAFDTVTDPGGAVRSWLGEHLFETEARGYAGPSYPQLYSYTTWRPGAASLPSDATATRLTFANGAAIAGYELTPAEPRPGDTALLSVYWRATRPIERDYQVFVHLLDHTGGKWDQVDGPPLRGHYPTTAWRPGEVVRDDYALRLPAALPAGLYRFAVGLYDLPTGARAPLADGAAEGASLGQLRVLPAAPAWARPEQPPLAALGPAIALQAYQVGPAQPRPGEQIDLALVWRALAPPPADYKVFVHLIALGDGRERIVDQRDAEPAEGRFPTSAWRAGDLIEDGYSLRLPGDAAPGTYWVAVGLYEPATLRRLPVSGRSDGRVLLGPFQLGD